jgi:hypothetical protein
MRDFDRGGRSRASLPLRQPASYENISARDARRRLEDFVSEILSTAARITSHEATAAATPYGDVGQIALNRLILEGFAKASKRYSDTLRKRNALPITETEDRLMASAAMSGLNNQPVTGYNTPAAKGIPNAL